MEIDVIETSNLPKYNGTRYVVVDKVNPTHILDDAQGYGYKTKQKAYAAYIYKNRSKQDKAKYEQKLKEIKNFIKEHHDFFAQTEIAMFYAMKDQEDFGYAEFKHYFEQEHFETELKPYDIWKVFIK